MTVIITTRIVVIFIILVREWFAQWWLMIVITMAVTIRLNIIIKNDGYEYHYPFKRKLDDNCNYNFDIQEGY